MIKTLKDRIRERIQFYEKEALDISQSGCTAFVQTHIIYELERLLEEETCPSTNSME